MTIAADTSVLIDLQQNMINAATEMLAQKLQWGEIVLPPIVITEFLSNPRLDKKTYQYVHLIKLLDIKEGYWERAAQNRSKLLQKNLKARLGDALIAQSCLDHDVPLLTRDPDFQAYAKYCGLKLAI